MKHLLAGAAFAAVAFGASAASADSYGLGRTCPQVYENGPYITAVCYNAFGGLNRSSIDARRCGYAGVGNANGRLACNGGGYGGGYGGGGFYEMRPHRGRGPNWD